MHKCYYSHITVNVNVTTRLLVTTPVLLPNPIFTEFTTYVGHVTSDVR